MQTEQFTKVIFEMIITTDGEKQVPILDNFAMAFMTGMAYTLPILFTMKVSSLEGYLMEKGFILQAKR